jgi:hypothetical protein
MATTPKPKPLTTRHALIIFLAMITAVAAGLLLYISIHSTALSILTAGGALVTSWRFYDEIIA